MSPLFVLGAVIGANWLGVYVGCWLYVLWSHVVFDFIHIGWHGAFVLYELPHDEVHDWHAQLWHDRIGVGLPFCVVYRRDVGEMMSLKPTPGLVHLLTHAWLWTLLGALYPVLYWAHYLFIYLFQHDRDPYFDCWAERLARRRAGQHSEGPIHDTGGKWPWW